jgi:hypothetical protein
MKKIIIILSMPFIFLLSGCGQQLDVTVWNASGIESYANQWIAITANWSDGGNRNLYPYTSAVDENNLDATNSVSFKAPENSKLTVMCNGQYYTADSTGNTTLTVFATDPYSQSLYGGFMDPGHWYAAAYKNAIVIYKK